MEAVPGTVTKLPPSDWLPINAKNTSGRFEKWGYPKIGVIMEHRTKMDDLGVPLFQETTIFTMFCPFAIES